MKSRALLFLALGVAAGYVLGARSGRERYEQLLAVPKQLQGGLDTFWSNPGLRKARADASAYAREQAPLLRARAEAVAKDAADRVATRAGDVRARGEKVVQRIGLARDNALVDIGNIGELGDDEEYEKPATQQGT
ncbi:MAG: protoporphyrinogen oxidase [Glaciihabitans sp.]|nr:protoporphyrinogen oxidase [Glaciihabitans sp.]